MNKNLYKITAHCGSRTLIYYVVATGTTKAEEAVTKLHTEKKWFNIDSFDSETVAGDGPYGKPYVLIP